MKLSLLPCLHSALQRVARPGVGKLTLAVAALSWAACALPAQAAPVLQTLLELGDQGSLPRAKVILGTDGALYGTTTTGGLGGYGTVFRVSVGGGDLSTLGLLGSVGSSNPPVAPWTGLALAPDGSYYGTSKDGGIGGGTVFKVTPAGVVSVVYSFPTDGNPSNPAPRSPFSTLTLRSVGGDTAFYGTTSGGGPNFKGTVFKMALDGTMTTVVDFTGTAGAKPGATPSGDLLLASDGNFYGTTQYGGANDLGTIYRMTPTGDLITLFEFDGTNGSYDQAGQPQAGGLIEVSPGEFYGTTPTGGTNGAGTVFKLTVSSDPIPVVGFTKLVDFGGVNEGVNPNGVLAAYGGELYGTTKSGGPDRGTAFKVTTTGVLTTLWEFNSNNAGANGNIPEAGLLLSGGNFYGTTRGGGGAGDGTVFKMTPAGVVTTLGEFGTEPSGLSAGLTLGTNGNLYGLTVAGGASGVGAFYSITPGGVFTKLGDLPAPAAGNGLVLGLDGNFYGTTYRGGAADIGTLFRFTPAGVYTTLLEFTGTTGPNLGATPDGVLTLDAAGNLYGVTRRGGAGNFGTVFKATTGGILTTLVEFTGAAGAVPGGTPLGGVTLGPDGNFYGATATSGATGRGNIYRLTPAGVLSVLADFSNALGGNPRVLVAVDAALNVYGATQGGGAYFNGTVYKVTPEGVATTLVDFTDNGVINKGQRPEGGLILGSDGNLYGTTSFGGPDGNGTLFRVTTGGTLTTLVEFTHDGATNRGSFPNGQLLEVNGTLYGVTNSSEAGGGTIYKLVAVPSTTILTATPPSAAVGESITLTATVTSTGTPAGQVVFKDGATVLGTGTLDGSGQTSLTVSTLTAGSHTITADYLGLVAEFAASTGSTGVTIDSGSGVVPITTYVTLGEARVLTDLTTHTATVTVLRTGAMGAVTVGYRTLSRTALPGTDYTDTTGTLTFAAGQTSATITVPILPNATPGRSFAIALYNPAPGVGLGSQPLTEVVINGTPVQPTLYQLYAQYKYMLAGQFFAAGDTLQGYEAYADYFYFLYLDEVTSDPASARQNLNEYYNNLAIAYFIAYHQQGNEVAAYAWYNYILTFVQ